MCMYIYLAKVLNTNKLLTLLFIFMGNIYLSFRSVFLSFNEKSERVRGGEKCSQQQQPIFLIFNLKAKERVYLGKMPKK